MLDIVFMIFVSDHRARDCEGYYPQENRQVSFELQKGKINQKHLEAKLDMRIIF